ncbi:MAG: hypothetical protein CM15mV149_020 [uncultured marine virus]|nr:MAG: hypothetical protein CM15mV149_020 [uncultured marine virus]
MLGTGTLKSQKTPQAKEWQGGHCTTPAKRAPCLQKKPSILTAKYCRNVLKWGTGAINIDAALFLMGMIVGLIKLRQTLSNKDKADSLNTVGHGFGYRGCWKKDRHTRKRAMACKNLSIKKPNDPRKRRGLIFAPGRQAQRVQRKKGVGRRTSKKGGGVYGEHVRTFTQL